MAACCADHGAAESLESPPQAASDGNLAARRASATHAAVLHAGDVSACQEYVELEAMLHNRAHLQLLEVNHSVDGAEDAKAQDRQQGRLQRRTTGPAIVRVGASCRSVMLQQLLLHGCQVR